MIGIFNDIIDYFTNQFDRHIVEKGDDELKLQEDYEKLDDIIQLLRSSVEVFNKSAEGRKRSGLISRYNIQQKQSKEGETVTNALSVADVEEYQMLQQKFIDATKPRDNAVSKKKDMKVKLEVYCLNRKYDPESAHNQIEDNWKDKEL